MAKLGIISITPILRTNSIDFADRGERSPKFQTSYKAGPFGVSVDDEGSGMELVVNRAFAWLFSVLPSRVKASASLLLLFRLARVMSVIATLRWQRYSSVIYPNGKQ